MGQHSTCSYNKISIGCIRRLKIQIYVFITYYQEYMKVARAGGEESIEHAICTVSTVGKVTRLPAYCMCD